MPTRSITRRKTLQGYADPASAPIYVDSDDDILKIIPAGSGSTEVQLIDSTHTQTITGDKTFTGTVVISGIATVTEFADGSAAAPSITFSDEKTTGIYRIGASNLGISLGGAIEIDISATALSPGVSDGNALGTTSLMWSDLFLASGGVINFNNSDVTITHASNKITVAGGVVAPGEGLDFTGLTPAASPISFSGVTLASSTNAIRGVGVTPTRVSGWTCFTGTLSGVSAYTDYRELRTAGADIVYGFGSFGFMDSGASGNTLLSLQAISTISSGATLASGSVLSGAYAAQFKMLFDGGTISSGAVSAVASFLYQSNVTPINGEQTSVLQLSVDSGLLQNIIHINAGASVLATYFLNVSEATAPFTTWGADAANCAGAPDLGIRCKVGAVEYWIPLYVNT